MQFLGMGFNMAAHDVGLEQSFNQTEKSLSSINGMVEDQNKLAKKTEKSGIWSKMREGVKSFNIASIAGNVRKLTGETGNLTSELEGMAVANAQATKPIIAQLDLSAKAAQKMVGRVSGMAIGMNVGATEVAEVFKAMAQAGNPAKAVLDELGMSQRDWVKLTTTSGISMAEMTGVMGDLAGEWKVAPAKAAGLLNSLVEIGKKTGTGIQALKTATSVVDEFGQVQFGLAQNLRLSGDEIANATLQAYKLSGAFRQMGANEEQAVTLGKDTAKMFMEQSAAYKKARSMGEPLPDDNLFIQLQQMGVDATRAMEIMTTGERDAVAGMIMMNEEIQKSAGGTEAHKVMLGKLAQTIGQTGQSLVWLAESSDVGARALQDVSNMALDGKSNLKSFGDQAFLSGRTLSQEFDLAKQSFDQQIRNIARANVGKLVQKQMKGYQRMGKVVKKLGSDETWGPLMNAYSTFQQMGARGVGLAFLDKNASKEAVSSAIDMGIGFEMGFDALKNVGEELAPVMEILGMFGPLGPIAAIGGVASLFLMDEADAKGILGGFYETFKNIKDIVMDVWDMIPFEKMWEKLKSTSSTVWHTLVDDIPWRQMIEDAKPIFKDIASELLGALSDAIGMLSENFSSGEFALGGAIMGGIMGGMAFGPFGALVGALSGALIAGSEAAASGAEKVMRDFADRKRKEKNDADAKSKKGILEIEKYRKDEAIKTDLLIAEGAKATYSKYLAESGTVPTMDMEDDSGQVMKFAIGLTGTDADFETPEFKSFAEDFREKAQLAFADAAPLSIDYSSKIGTKGVGAKLAMQEYAGVQREQDRAFASRIDSAQKQMKEMGAIGTFTWGVGGGIGTGLAKLMDNALNLTDDLGFLWDKLDSIDSGALFDSQSLLMDEFKLVQNLPQVQQTFEELGKAGASSAEYLAAAQDAVANYSGMVSKDLAQTLIDSQAFGSGVAITVPQMAKHLKGLGEIIGRDLTGDLLAAETAGEDLNMTFIRIAGELSGITGTEFRVVTEGMIDDADRLSSSWDNFGKAVDRAMGMDQSLSREDAEWSASSWENDYEQSVQDPIEERTPENQADAALKRAVDNFAAGASGAMGKVAGSIDLINSELKTKTDEMAVTALAGGGAVAHQFGLGFSKQGAIDDILDVMTDAAGFLGGSLPEKGPLGGVPGNNPAFLGGRSVAEQFGQGFISAEGEISLWIGDSMTRLVDTVFSSYEQAMQDQMGKSSAMSQIADQIIQQFGGTVFMGKLSADADLSLSSGKDLFKVALDKPGLVSVVTAVITSGQETQKILLKIKEQNDDMLGRPIMSKTLRFTSGTMTTAG